MGEGPVKRGPGLARFAKGRGSVVRGRRVFTPREETVPDSEPTASLGPSSDTIGASGRVAIVEDRTQLSTSYPPARDGTGAPGGGEFVSLRPMRGVAENGIRIVDEAPILPPAFVWTPGSGVRASTCAIGTSEHGPVVAG
jgi:hypothetical protein